MTIFDQERFVFEMALAFQRASAYSSLLRIFSSELHVGAKKVLEPRLDSLLDLAALPR